MRQVPDNVRQMYGGEPEPPKPKMEWPRLGSEAVFGTAGRYVHTVDPHTEADQAAVLFTYLSAAGNAIGRGAYVKVGGEEHHAKINFVLVGDSSKARKGMSLRLVKLASKVADAEWAENCMVNGLSSGEGLIHAVRDPVWGKNKNGEDVLLDAGVEEKRLFVIEEEFAGPLKVANREGNTLSPVIRQAWDDTTLGIITKNTPTRATDSHVTIAGHITHDELIRRLTETESANGFANRFVWVLARRSKKLPFGGELNKVNMTPHVKHLKEGIEFGRGVGEVRWGATGAPIWEEAYEKLSEGDPGMFGAVTSRAEAQVLRLALVYAVLDFSDTIEEPHLMAALAAWKYAEDSARYIFGDATGDEVADRIMTELRSKRKEGMSRDDIYRIWKGNRPKDEVTRALDFLLRLGSVRQEKQDTGGRPREIWFAVR
jgi:hypothetical protein